MALAAEADRQDVVRVPGGLAPDGRQRGVPPDEVLATQRLHPRQAVGVGPDGVVDPAEVDVEAAPALEEEVRQQERHLEERERVLLRPGQLVPRAGVGRHVRRAGHELVPTVGRRPTGRADRARQDVEEEEAAGGLPAADDAGRAGPPVVRGQRRPGPGDELGDRLELGGRDTRFRARRTRTCSRRTAARARPRSRRTSGVSRSGRAARRYSAQLVQRSTNDRSNRPVTMRCRAIDRRSAGSLPGQAASHWSAWAAVLDSRGSTTTSFAPFRRPSMIRWACGLK